MAVNNIQGKTVLLEIFDINSSTFKLVGGVDTKDFNRDNPVADVTNQSTSGDETESCPTGYGTVTINGNGSVDTRADDDIAAYKYFATIANSSNPSATFRLSDALETYEGVFNITSFGKSVEENGILTFTMALQNQGAITYT